MSDWKVGLFGCISSLPMMLAGCFATPLIQGKNAESIGEDATLWAMMTYAPCISALLRQQIRKKHGIDGELWKDTLFWCCCPCCAAGQEAIQTGSIDYLLDDKALNEGAQKYDQDIART
ncbi:unnamed protein product [Oikopleura dioica]|uniref:Uncharacterized protein n=1 Tax=Oikopleura dioica TaxID=34765 RepID=E4X232_OIKDI|nr:unnamed protein product [Oikopleura dioica]CBY36724.1 unnamed protein product [Oikopleura dioica]